jgi:hypothetical protein
MNKNNKHTTFLVDKDLLIEFKTYCAEKDVTMTSLIIKLMEDCVKQKYGEWVI